MGYNLHVTRAEFWAENRGQEISSDEWTALVKSDATLTFNPRNGPYFAELESPSRNSPRWLDWSEGNIVSKNPDRETLGKMLEIAVDLRASVQGDDGEQYVNINDLPELTASGLADSRGPNDLPRYLRRETRWNWLVYALIALAVLAVNLFDLW